VLKLPKLMEIVGPHLQASTLRMVNVYIREAHPVDGWEFKANASGAVALAVFGTPEKLCITQTCTLEERLLVANRFQAAISAKGLHPVPMLLDDPATNALEIAYEALPDRLVVLSANGDVLFSTGQGPFQYSLERFRAFLVTASL